MKNLNTIEILKEIISIPSWVDKKTNEIEVGNWIVDFLNKNSSLKAIKQDIGNGRFNILATNSNEINILVTGHIDTVQPNSGWTKNPTNPEIIGNKLYGLGTTDMKSGVAVILYLSTLPNLNENTGFLFYCDEEYDFLGMKKFLEKYNNKMNPKTVISLDGEGLQIGNSCRGLIELKADVQGKAGHAANPKSGVNAITESFKVIEKLKMFVSKFKSDELGSSTLNIAYIAGGSDQGNIIANNCEYIVEIRISDEKLNANLVKEFITKESEKLGLRVINTIIRHDLGNWVTKKEELNKFIKFSKKKKLKSAKRSGYIDIQMLWKAFDKPTIFSYGVGEKGMSHKADEYVLISNVLKAQKFFERILTK